MNYAYRLSVIGDENTIRAYEASPDCRTELDKAWDSTQPFVLRRRYFPTFPRVLRVSRKHLEIHCEEGMSDEQPERTYWVCDLSTNGTWVNGQLLEKGIRTPLNNEDEIFIINDELSDGTKVRFGFRFTVFNEEDAPKIPQPPAQFVAEFKEKRIRHSTKKRNREYEFSESEEERKNNGKKKASKKRNDSDTEFPSQRSFARSKRPSFEEEEKDFPIKKETVPPPVVTSPPPKKSDRIMKQWTPEEEQKLVEIMAKSEGKSWKEIAIHFPHRSPDAVRNKFKKMSETDKVAKSFWAATISKQQARAAANAAGVVAPSTPANDEVPPPLEKDQMQIDPETVDQKDLIVEGEEQIQRDEEEEDRRRKLWTAEEDEQLRALVKKLKPNTNEDWEVIAAKLGRTVKSVKHKYNDHNLKYLIDS